MTWKRGIMFTTLLTIAACGGGDSTSPPDTFPTTVGAFCAASRHSTATPADGGGFDVVLLYDVTGTRTVTDDQGFFRQQTVLSCVEVHLVGTITASSPEEAVTRGRELFIRSTSEPGEFHL